MGKGKKARDAKKATGSKPAEELPDVSSLTISEGQPSTSSETAAPSAVAEPAPSKEEEEDEGGLGLGLGKSRKKKKKAAVSKPAEDLPDVSSLTISEGQPSTSSETAAPSAVVEPAPTKEEEEDEGGLGLGLGKSRKKKRKPKSAGAGGEQSKESTPAPSTAGTQAAAAHPPVEQPGARWGPQKQPAQPPQASVPQAGPPGFAQPYSQVGLQQPGMPGPGPQHIQGAQPGFPFVPGQPGPQYTQGPQPGYPGLHQGPQPGFPGQPGPQYTQGPQPGFPGQPGPQYTQGPQPGYPGQPGLHQGPLPGFPGQPGPQYTLGPQPGFPGQPGLQYTQGPQPGFPGLPGQPGPQQTQGPPSGWQQPGVGRGQGRGQQPSAAVPAPVAPGQSRPAQPQPIASSSAPPQRTQPHQVTSRGDARKSPSETTVCRFKIPDKIIGNKVPARMIYVLANYLPMTIKNLKIFRYDVSFKPDKPKKMIPRAFNAAKGKHYPKHLIAFDQMKNCYSLTELPNVPLNERFATNVELEDNNGRKMTFEVSFKATGKVDLGTITNHIQSGGSSLNPPTEAIQCIDVILRQGTLENYIKAGRQFFKRPERPTDLGDGLEMWTGLFQSAIFTNRPFINIDVAHKGFPRQQLMIDALTRDFKLELNMPLDRQRNTRSVENFKLFIKGLRVMASIGGDCSSKGQRREFICNELVDPPNKISFTMTDANGKETKMTVADYFAREKRVRLQYPNLNCMWVGPRDKKIYYPLELLEVSYGQARNKQLNDMQLSTMVREAASPPDVRKRKIEEVIRDMKYSKNEYFKQFGLDIDDQFLKVEARVLTPPELDVGAGRAIRPAKGAWMANRLLKPEPLESWAVIAIELDCQRSNSEQIIALFKSCGNQLGMRVAEPKGRFFNVDMRNLHAVFCDAISKGCQFLVIIVPTRGRDYYHRVKQLAEREVGILTQCIKEFTASRKMNNQTAKNLLLKVNSKLMGINQALDRSSIPSCLASGGVMVVGADVTHPSPDQTSLPSIAAVTASMDPKCFCYSIQLSIQTPKKEMIVEFEDMMVEHLQEYKSKLRALPKKIFVYRDGVSEGQFAQVMESELTAVHRAYRRMTGTNEKPEVLFLLVQKRHHTRFFNVDPKSASYNVEPGTVVDKNIVHPKELDFYLVSHQAIKGTARPTRYHAVCNDGKIPHDEVEQLTYYLCHLYSRCMRSVSYPTPTYYAHLACLRARSLTFGERFNNQELEGHPIRLRVLDRMLDISSMFFV